MNRNRLMLPYRPICPTRNLPIRQGRSIRFLPAPAGFPPPRVNAGLLTQAFGFPAMVFRTGRLVPKRTWARALVGNGCFPGTDRVVSFFQGVRHATRLSTGTIPGASCGVRQTGACPPPQYTLGPTARGPPLRRCSRSQRFQLGTRLD
jgi:hypothetical protein